jgi:hypothetical protein
MNQFDTCSNMFIVYLFQIIIIRHADSRLPSYLHGVL